MRREIPRRPGKHTFARFPSWVIVERFCLPSFPITESRGRFHILRIMRATLSPRRTSLAKWGAIFKAHGTKMRGGDSIHPRSIRTAGILAWYGLITRET